MKFCLFLFFFALVFTAGAQQHNPRTAYYRTGMTATIRYYDSVLQQMTAERAQNKLTETAFLAGYSRWEHLYRAQQEVVSGLAQQWSEWEKPGKAARFALQLLAQGQTDEAIRYLEDKMSRKLTQKSKNDVRLLSDLYRIGGRCKEASQAFHPVLSSKLATTSDHLFAIDLIAGQGRFDEAADSNRALVKRLVDDTLQWVTAEVQLARIYKMAQGYNEALSALIKARYLLQQLQSSKEQQFLQAHVLTQMAALQSRSNDFDNAYNNAKISVSLFDAMGTGSFPADAAEASHILAMVCKRAGANATADTFYQKSLTLYRGLAMVNPERYAADMVAVLDEYGEVKKWFDKDDEYERMLREAIVIRESLATETGYPFFRYDLGHTYNVLAQKIMNVNVKLLFAEEQWLKAKETLAPLFVTHPVLAGNELCNVYYKLAGSKSAFKKTDEAYAYFLQSLKAREYLYQLVPSQNSKDLATVLIQTANFDANKNDFRKAVERLDRAEGLAQEAGDARQAEEIVRFRELLKKKL